MSTVRCIWTLLLVVFASSQVLSFWKSKDAVSLLCPLSRTKLGVAELTRADLSSSLDSRLINKYAARLYGDGQQYKCKASIAARSSRLRILDSSCVFTPRDVGKSIRIVGAGLAQMAGQLIRVSVIKAGAGYTSIPTATVTGGNDTKLQPVMSLVSNPTIASGGSGMLGGGSGTIMLLVAQTNGANSPIATGGIGRPAVVRGTVTDGVLTAVTSILDAGAYVAPASGPWSGMPPTSAAPTLIACGVATAAVSAGVVTGVVLSNVSTASLPCRNPVTFPTVNDTGAFVGVSFASSGGLLSGAASVYNGGQGIAGPVGIEVQAATGYQANLPTLNLSFGVLALNVIDPGWGVPTSGATVAFSGGSPSSAATAGTPVVTPATNVFSATIAGYTDAQDVILSASAASSLSAQATTVFWGHDDLPALQAAVNSLGKILVPAGSYWTSGSIIMPANGSINGLGYDATNLTLMPGANSDLFTSAGAYFWLGSNSYSGTTPDGFEIGNLHGSGNASNQGIVNPTQQNGIAWYAAQQYVHDLRLDSIVGNLLRSGYQTNGSGGGRVDNVGTTLNVGVAGCGRHGWDYSGPHDIESTNFVAVDCGQEADNTYDGLYAHGVVSGTFSAFHPWHTGSATKRYAYALYDTHGSLNFMQNSQFEGGRANVYVGAGGDTFLGSQEYAHYGSPGSALLTLLGSNSTFVNVSFGGTEYAPWYAIQLGILGDPATSNQFVGFSSTKLGALGTFNLVNSSGNNILTGHGTSSASFVTSIGGALQSTDVFQYNETGGAVLILGGIACTGAPSSHFSTNTAGQVVHC